MKTATWRIAAIYIDCPTEGCGGGVESYETGSFMLTVGSDEPAPVMDQQGKSFYYHCAECGEKFRVPPGALRALQG